jgi:hypothetical protein
MKINGSPDEDTLKFIRKVQGKQVDDVCLEALIENISVVPWHTPRGVYIGPDGPGSPNEGDNLPMTQTESNRRWSCSKTF